MPTFVVFIVLSAVMFLLYRFKAMTLKSPLVKKFMLSKANIAMGVFLISFGLNRLFVQPQTITYVVSGLFILYGLFFVYDHINRSRFYFQEIRQQNNLRTKRK